MTKTKKNNAVHIAENILWQCVWCWRNNNVFPYTFIPTISKHLLARYAHVTPWESLQIGLGCSVPYENMLQAYDYIIERSVFQNWPDPFKHNMFCKCDAWPTHYRQQIVRYFDHSWSVKLGGSRDTSSLNLVLLLYCSTGKALWRLEQLRIRLSVLDEDTTTLINGNDGCLCVNAST